MNLRQIKAKTAELMCGVIILFGMVWGGFTLIGVLSDYILRDPRLEWVPSIYLLMPACGIFFGYIYGLIKLMQIVATWADA